MEIKFIYKKKKEKKKITIDLSTEKGLREAKLIIAHEMLVKEGLNIVLGNFGEFKHSWKLYQIKVDGVVCSLNDILSGNVILSVNGKHIMPPKKMIR